MAKWHKQPLNLIVKSSLSEIQVVFVGFFTQNSLISLFELRHFPKIWGNFMTVHMTLFTFNSAFWLAEKFKNPLPILVSFLRDNWLIFNSYRNFFPKFTVVNRDSGD